MWITVILNGLPWKWTEIILLLLRLHASTAFQTKTKERCRCHHRGLECKSRKSRDTWNNRQVWRWSRKWSRTKANRVLPRECSGHSKHPLPTTKETTLHMDITRWSTQKSDWLYSLKPIQSDAEALYNQQKQDWATVSSWTPYCQIQTEIEESRDNH